MVVGPLGKRVQSKKPLQVRILSLAPICWCVITGSQPASKAGVVIKAIAGSNPAASAKTIKCRVFDKSCGYPKKGGGG